MLGPKNQKEVSVTEESRGKGKRQEEVGSWAGARRKPKVWILLSTQWEAKAGTLRSR